MKSIIATAYGGPEVLEITEVECPVPQDNELLIRIHATAITGASTFMREGKPYFSRLFMGFNKPKIDRPGTDLAGVVESVGANVSKFKVGDKVMASTDLKCGAYAEYITLAEDDILVHQPNNSTAEEATGIIDGACTALAFFTDQVQLKKGDKILINGASGSIGTAAVQLAKYFGAEVTAMCSTRNKSLVKDLGADFVLDYTKDELDNHTEQFDVIFDTVGKLSYRHQAKHLRKGGVFLTPVLTGATLFNLLFISPFSSRKLKFAATGLRSELLRKRDLKHVRDLMQLGALQTVIDKVYPFEYIQEAHHYVDTGRKRGNVILSMM